MFYIQQTTIIEALLRYATASPSPPYVSAYFITSPNLVVQCGSKRCNLSSLVLGPEPFVNL